MSSPTLSHVIEHNEVQKEKSLISPNAILSYNNSLNNQSGSSDLSDNRAPPNQTNQTRPAGDDTSPNASPPLELVLAELREIKQQVSEIKEIKQQISKLDKSVTGSLSDKLTGMMNRTSEIETAVRTNAARLREYDDQFVTLKASVDKHEKSFASIISTKDEFSKTKDKAVSDMNKLISIQEEQVNSFNSTTKKVSKNILAEVDKRFAQLKRQADFKDLKNQAFNNRNNLVLVGLPEDPNKDTPAIVKDFLENT